ncbi:MAG: AAA family ATPase [Pelistega sp.]|nr:AAA family ATPase [Pelistega sp.]
MGCVDLEKVLGHYLQAQFPHEKLKIVHTHISTVFLIADKAYKLKKTLKLPFLDFSTLEQRKHFSEEELRLNQRQCPELYLALHTVCGSIDSDVTLHSLNQVPEGEPLYGAIESGITLDSATLPVIDYLLEMQRFDSCDEFAQMAQEGTLNSEHMQKLAIHMAEFHSSLKPVFAKDSAKRTADWARESFDEIAAIPLFQSLPKARAEELKRWREVLLQRFQALEKLRNQRMEQGFVRECHGDLHLGNIVMWQGQAFGFDALEFDVNLRTIDVIQDVAFVFMDLYAYDLGPLAWEFINSYLELSGDYRAMPLLLMYAAYKALVRAKVALLAQDLNKFECYWQVLGELLQHTSFTQLSPVLMPRKVSEEFTEAVPQTQSKALEKRIGEKRLTELALPSMSIAANRHIDLCSEHKLANSSRQAESVQQLLIECDTAKPGIKFLMMMGVSGSGKSVAASLLAAHIGALRLRSDAERKRLLREGQLIDEQGQALALYSKQASTLTNQRLDSLTVYLMKHGFNVVLDTVAPFQGRREFLRDLALEHHAAFYVIRVVAPVASLIQRLEQRTQEGKDLSDATKEVMLEQQTIMQDLPQEWEAFSFTIHNDGDLADLKSKVNPIVAQLMVS